MEFIKEFILNNLNMISSFIALVLSIMNTIYLISTNKKRVGFEINHYSEEKVSDKKLYYFNIELINKSRLPISVNEITIESSKQNYKFIKSPRLLFEVKTTKGEEVTDRNKIYSIKFPININGLCSEQAFTVIYGPNEFDDNVKVTLKTSRGKIKKRIKNMHTLKIDNSTLLKELLKYK